VVPLVNAVYVPIHKPFSTLVGSPGVWLPAAALLGLVVIKRRAAVSPPHCLLLATSSGFLVAFLVQGKGWPYHSYPLLALATIALGAAAIERNSAAPAAVRLKRRIERLGPMLLIELVIVAGFVWMNLATDTT